MAIVPSINLSGINLSGLNLGAVNNARNSSRTASRAATRVGAGTSAARPAATSTASKGAALGGARPAATSAAAPRPGATGVAKYSRDPRYPDLGPTAGRPEAPRPELSPAEVGMYEQQQTGYERTSGQALGLGTRGPDFTGRARGPQASLAAAMASRQRRRRPGFPMV